MAFHRSHGGRNREIDASGHLCYDPLTSTSSFHLHIILPPPHHPSTPKDTTALYAYLQRCLSPYDPYLMPRFDVLCNVYFSLAVIFIQGKSKAKETVSFLFENLVGRERLLKSR